MKWLKSTSPKRWTLAAGTRQLIVPSVDDTNYLQLADEDFAVVEKQPVVASLIRNKSLLILDEEPAELKNTIPALQSANADLVTELADAKAKIGQLEAELAQAQADAKAALEAKQKELEELDAKASGIIAEKEAAITKLEKQVKKLTKNDE